MWATVSGYFFLDGNMSHGKCSLLIFIERDLNTSQVVRVGILLRDKPF